jgi:hypothetical protein
VADIWRERVRTLRPALKRKWNLNEWIRNI